MPGRQNDLCHNGIPECPMFSEQPPTILVMTKHALRGLLRTPGSPVKDPDVRFHANLPAVLLKPHGKVDIRVKKIKFFVESIHIKKCPPADGHAVRVETIKG